MFLRVVLSSEQLIKSTRVILIQLLFSPTVASHFLLCVWMYKGLSECIVGATAVAAATELVDCLNRQGHLISVSNKHSSMCVCVRERERTQRLSHTHTLTVSVELVVRNDANWRQERAREIENTCAVCE